ncbi:hypothetical protein HON01_04690 [Candidatus Woesearchaeota archaeon]|jgi:hypothetical protein|nr:hypothetical protein [Candidatus Woesearchaeota archaeon]MBT7366855.1 hypothetical protein [Candidatus Woesearchaeota archaeon]
MEPQTTTQSTIQPAFSLKKLKGIKPKGVKVKEDNIPSLLATLGGKAVFEFMNSDLVIKRRNPFTNSIIEQGIPFTNSKNFYNEFYDQTDEFFGDIEYNQEDLSKAIEILHNINKCDPVEKDKHYLRDFFESNLESFCNGMYTAFLVDKLTEINREKGKNTKIRINGGGKRFDFLFACARNIDELIIENFKGNCIGAYIGDVINFANKITITGCEGNDIGSGIGSVDSLIIINNFGNRIASNLSRKTGNLNSALIAHNFGFGMAYQIQGNHFSGLCGGLGANLVMVANNSIPYDEYRKNSKQDYIICQDMQYIDILFCYGNNAVLDDQVAARDSVQEIITDEDIAKHYFDSKFNPAKNIKNRYKIKQILEEINSNRIKDLQETLRVYERARELNNSK